MKNLFFLLMILLAVFGLSNRLAVDAADSGNSVNPKWSKTLAQASWRPCPKACLKLSDPGWVFQYMEGKPDYLIWMNFPYKEASGGGECWSLDHLGDIIEYEGSRPVEQGPCPTCKKRLYVGDPTKDLKKAEALPVHPRTARKESETVLGRPWMKQYVQAGANEVVSWFLKQLPEKGWAIVDRTTVSDSTFFVITDGAQSKWMKISPSESPGNTEVILMSRL